MSLCLGRLAPWEQFSTVWITWWLGDMVSVLTVTPLLMLWMRRPVERPKLVQIPEAAALLVAVFLVAALLSWARTLLAGLTNLSSTSLYFLCSGSIQIRCPWGDHHRCAHVRHCVMGHTSWDGSLRTTASQ